MSEFIARTSEADLRRVHGEIDARVGGQEPQSSDMPTPVGPPRSLRPERVVTDAGGKDEYDEQLRETLRYMRSGRPMPRPAGDDDMQDDQDQGGSGGAASSSSGPVRDQQASAEHVRGAKRSIEVDDGDRKHKSVCIETLESLGEDMSYEDFCKALRLEFPIPAAR